MKSSPGPSPVRLFNESMSFVLSQRKYPVSRPFYTPVSIPVSRLPHSRLSSARSQLSSRLSVCDACRPPRAWKYVTRMATLRTVRRNHLRRPPPCRRSFGLRCGYCRSRRRRRTCARSLCCMPTAQPLPRGGRPSSHSSGFTTRLSISGGDVQRSGPKKRTHRAQP